MVKEHSKIKEMNKFEKDQFAEWIFSGKMDKVKEAVKLDFNLDEDYRNGMTPLQIAVEGDQPEILELLLMNGANPNQLSEYNGMAALHWAVDYAVDGMTQGNREIPYPEPIKCIRILLNYGADKNIKDHKGKSPLDYHMADDIRKEFTEK